MKVVTYSHARNALKSVLDGVVQDADVTIISRRDAEGDAVVMSPATPRTPRTLHDPFAKTAKARHNPANCCPNNGAPAYLHPVRLV
jgi:hypothetical protein